MMVSHKVLGFSMLCSIQLSVASFYNKASAGLISFPSDVASDVYGVFLSENAISFISASDLTGFSHLTHLDASHNALTKFPDIRPLGNTLNFLMLSREYDCAYYCIHFVLQII